MKDVLRLSLSVLPVRLAVCRLAPDREIPTPSLRGAFWSLTRTDDELSLVTDVHAVPRHVSVEKTWSCLKVEGPLEFGLVGVLDSISRPLADARVSLLALSTFDTDYILVREQDLGRARTALTEHGHTVHDDAAGGL